MAHRSNTSGQRFQVRIPTWRLDVEREIDLLEELARIYGYNKFPNTLPRVRRRRGRAPRRAKNAKVRETMLALGLRRVHLDHLHLRSRKRTNDSARRLRSACAGQSAERRGRLHAYLAAARAAQHGQLQPEPRQQRRPAVRSGRGLREDRRPPRRAAASGIRRNRRPVAARRSFGCEPYTFFHMKGDIEELLAAFQHTVPFTSTLRRRDTSIPVARREPFWMAKPWRTSGSCIPSWRLHASCARKSISPRSCSTGSTNIRCGSQVMSASRSSRQSSATSPSSSTTPSPSSESGPLSSRWESTRLTAFAPGEIYRGEKVGPGKYSVLLHAEFQSKERTLRDDEVAQWSAHIIGKLEVLGGVLRAQ